MDILKDPKTGTTDLIHICYTCNDYPDGKPIINDPGATKDLNTGQWTCSSCNDERITKMQIRRLGENHPDVKYKIAAEDKRVLKLNDAAKRLNDKAGSHVIKYIRNKYTGRMLLSSN